MPKLKLIIVIFIFLPLLGQRNTSADTPFEDIRIQVNLETITPQNINRLTEVAFIGTGNVNDMVWMSDEKRIAIAGSSGLWLVNTENLFEDFIRLSNHKFLSIAHANMQPNSILVAADLAAGSMGVGVPTIEVWDANSHEMAYILDSPIGSNVLELNRDGSLLLAGDTRRDVHLYDMNRRDLINTITNIGPIPSSFAFLPDQNVFTVGGTDSSQLVLWALSEFRQEVYSVDEPSNAVAYDPNDDLLATISGDALRIRRAADMNLIRSIDGFSNTNSIIFSNDGAFFVQQDLVSTNIWRTSTLLTETNPIPVQSLPIGTFTLSPDSSKIALYFDNHLSIWEIGGELISEIQFNPLCEDICTPIVAISLENGELIVDTAEAKYSISIDFEDNENITVNSSGNFSSQFTESQATYIIFIEGSETNELEIILPENLQDRYLYSPTISPKEDLIVAGSYDGLYFWDTATGELIAKVTTSDIELISFSEDGRLVLTYGRGAPSVRFWGVPSQLNGR